MKPRVILLLVGGIAVCSCGREADLKPASGKPLPIKPLMAREQPTPEQLLKLPTYAKPNRVDELIRQSQPRQSDPFDLPPPTGGAAEPLPAGTDQQPASNQTSTSTPGG